eukprot:CAMPEP_0184558882 /NCGR_PEP_ID=MMETSP0199_2-20130426/46143_1 /TAXON_ID=1112570 /ORGANISM="Thraustochytrium sp., Strain LLF1b" /LENGTH=392 /DNA_ID=CAMNT_0026956155 /DNA_START=166 /DNA_END=1341 /DNA_ORIENTATION=-
MRVLTARNVLLTLIAFVVYKWTCVKPKITWKPSNATKFESCPEGTKETMLFFGATSMLGRYVVDSFLTSQDLCIVNFGRSHCPLCHVNVKGDLRDVGLVQRVFDEFDVHTVLTAVRPPLLGVHYRDYIELNLLSMIELSQAAKKAGVRHFIYVSSIACASHYIPHHNATEADPQPFLTHYEAPYDVSKRLAEDFIIDLHEPGVFDVVSIRTGGIYGGSGDPYEHYQYLPFILSFDVPAVVDANYAGNIGDALVAVREKLKQDPSVGGQFYYYTGDHIPEGVVARFASDATDRPLVTIPYFLLEIVIDVWSYLRFDHNTYSYLDLLKMAVIPQTFDQTKFHSTFTNFKQKYTLEQALHLIYGTGTSVKASTPKQDEILADAQQQEEQKEHRQG